MVCALTLYHYSCSHHSLTDQVEKVVHETSTHVSTVNDAENEQLDDVDMADGTTSVPKKTRKKREKKIIPVGGNGLKKKKVTKTRRMIDENGYMREYLFEPYVSLVVDPPNRYRRLLRVGICG